MKTWAQRGLPRLPVFSCMQMKCISGHTDPGTLKGEQPVPCSHTPLTIVSDQPVLPGQAQLLLPLPHDSLHLRGKAVQVTGEHEGVAVSAGAIEVQEAAGVLHSIGVVVRVNDPVVIVCKAESHGATASPSATRMSRKLTAWPRKPATSQNWIQELGSRRLQRILTALRKLGP